MHAINPRDAPSAIPLDELLQECEEAAACDFRRLPEENRIALEKLAESSKEVWRSLFAFRGQSKLHLVKIRSATHSVVSWISLHASGYRFVHDLDWTVHWWTDASGQTPTEALALYHSIDTKTKELLERLARWRLHLARHPLTRDLAERVTNDATRRFRESDRIQELFFRPLVTTDQNRELHHAVAEAFQWELAVVGSLGQHYGIRSQYLDLTYSPKVAARFALQNNWQQVLNGERVYGCIMSFMLPSLLHRIREFRQKWASAYPTIADISWIPAAVAKRPSLQHGLSLSNSPSPIFGPHIVESDFFTCTPFYTVPCREMEDIVKMNLLPDDDPFLEVVESFQVADEHRQGVYFK
jgi:hypothetical protein